MGGIGGLTVKQLWSVMKGPRGGQLYCFRSVGFLVEQEAFESGFDTFNMLMGIQV
jgi:hypothetical protein